MHVIARNCCVVATLTGSLINAQNPDGGPTNLHQVFSIHGSGTTSISRCVWDIMSLFEQRSKVPTKLTYRAVGTSTGQKEFIGDQDFFIPYNSFGAGDAPISTDKYEMVNAAVLGGGEGETEEGTIESSDIIHLPFAMSSYTFFHNIPGVSEGESGIKLDPCILARIFNGKIQEWSDPEIVALNPDLEDLLGGSISVLRRARGSASTALITEFFHEKCSSEWPADKVGTMIDWHVSTYGCEKMTACIGNNVGTIGYIESNDGWLEGLIEVNLQNEDGFFLASRLAQANGGISAAAESANVPKPMSSNWDGIDFMNKGGRFTWPIVKMSYIYLRVNVPRYIESEEERGLLKIFLESLYEEKYFNACQGIGFSPIPRMLRSMALEAIDKTDWGFTSERGNLWTLEFNTMPVTGMDKYVISSKRAPAGELLDISKMEMQDYEDRLGALEYFSVGSLLREDNANKRIAELETLIEDLELKYKVLAERMTPIPSPAPTVCNEGNFDKFFLKFRYGKPMYKTCSWLKQTYDGGVRTCLTKLASNGGVGPAKDVCPETCGMCSPISAFDLGP